MFTEYKMNTEIGTYMEYVIIFVTVYSVKIFFNLLVPFLTNPARNDLD
jgi:hypothetical protein